LDDYERSIITYEHPGTGSKNALFNCPRYKVNYPINAARLIDSQEEEARSIIIL